MRIDREICKIHLLCESGFMSLSYQYAHFTALFLYQINVYYPFTILSTDIIKLCQNYWLHFLISRSIGEKF